MNAGARIGRPGDGMKIAAILVVILALYGIVGEIDMRAAETTAVISQEARQRLAAARELERGMRDCPAPGPGMTDVVVMIVHSTADAGPTVTRCMRLAERPYVPRRRP